jgi:hypothetical protein
MTAGGDSAQAMESWSTAYNACYQLCEDEKLDECIRVAKSHLRDESMPLHHRMLFELILARSIGCWYEANGAIRRCEAIWQSMYAYHGHDHHKDVQERLAETRQLIDDARREHDRKPRPMRDPRLAEYDGYEDDDLDDVAEWFEVDVDWSSEEVPYMEPGESEDVGETMEVDSGIKPGVERIPSERVEVEVDADAKRSMPQGIVKVDDIKSVVEEVNADAKRSMSSGIAKVEDVKPVKEPSLKRKQSEVAMMDGQTQPVESAGSELDGSAKKKPSLASRLLKSTKSTMGLKGKDHLKEVKKRGSVMSFLPFSLESNTRCPPCA